MTRDQELIRKLMLELEASEHPRGIDYPSRYGPQFDGGEWGFTYSQGEKDWGLRARDYSLLLMSDAGIVVGEKGPIVGDFHGGHVRLTNAGHDALGAVQDEALWRKLRNSAPGEAYEIAKSVLSGAGLAAISEVMGWG